MSSADTSATVIKATEQWLERAVIGLNLCPFAKAVHIKQQIRFVLSPASTAQALLETLHQELLTLIQTPAQQIDTTLLIHPEVLQDFLDYNDFLGEADALLESLELDGQIQIASFHPQYQFAGSNADDIENYTNRSPYPMLHLLREDSVARAVAAIPDPEDIFTRNMATLQSLGHAGWLAILHPDGKNPDQSTG